MPGLCSLAKYSVYNAISVPANMTETENAKLLTKQAVAASVLKNERKYMQL